MRTKLGQALSEAGRAADHAMPVAVRLVVDFRDQAWDRPVADRRTARGTSDELHELMSAYEDAGVTHIIVDPASGDVGKVKALWDRFVDEVVKR